MGSAMTSPRPEKVLERWIVQYPSGHISCLLYESKEDAVCRCKCAGKGKPIGKPIRVEIRELPAKKGKCK